MPPLRYLRKNICLLRYHATLVTLPAWAFLLPKRRGQNYRLALAVRRTGSRLAAQRDTLRTLPADAWAADILRLPRFGYADFGRTRTLCLQRFFVLPSTAGTTTLLPVDLHTGLRRFTGFSISREAYLRAATPDELPTCLAFAGRITTTDSPDTSAAV